MTTPTTPEPPQPRAGAASAGGEFRHTPFCVGVPNDDGPCEVAGWCGTPWTEVYPPGCDATAVYEVQLYGSYDSQRGDHLWAELFLRITEDDEVHTHPIPFDQADELAAVLVALAARGRGIR